MFFGVEYLILFVCILTGVTKIDTVYFRGKYSHIYTNKITFPLFITKKTVKLVKVKKKILSYSE